MRPPHVPAQPGPAAAAFVRSADGKYWSFCAAAHVESRVSSRFHAGRFGFCWKP